MFCYEISLLAVQQIIIVPKHSVLSMVSVYQKATAHIHIACYAWPSARRRVIRPSISISVIVNSDCQGICRSTRRRSPSGVVHSEVGHDVRIRLSQWNP